MTRTLTLAALLAAAPMFAAVLLVPAPALAQTETQAEKQSPSPGAQQDQPATPPPSATQAAPPTPASQPNPDGALAVTQVKLTKGQRVGKLIGSTVYAQGDNKIGTVDDIVLDPANRASLAILQVGGFLGVGGKLVAVPFESLKAEQDGRLRLPDATKDSLAAMPAFTYSQG